MNQLEQDFTMTETEIAFRAAINVLRDTIESARMPSGQPFAPDAAALHARTAEHLENLLRQEQGKGPQ